MENSAGFICLKRTSTPVPYGSPYLNKYADHVMLIKNFTDSSEKLVEAFIVSGEKDVFLKIPIVVLVPAEFLQNPKLFLPHVNLSEAA
jgi:hypothetical protein